MKLLYFVVLLVFGANTSNNAKISLEITENLTTVTCMWGDTQCFIECSFVNLTTNVTYLRNRKKLVQNDSITDKNKTHLVLNINGQETKCNVTKCVSSEISALINESSNSNDLKRLIRIKDMCTDLFESPDSSIKDIYFRAQKIYILFLINTTFNETTINYDLEEFNMTVVKMMNFTHYRLVVVSAPKMSLSLEEYGPVQPSNMNVSGDECKLAIMMYSFKKQFMHFMPIQLSQEFKGKVTAIFRIETHIETCDFENKQFLVNFQLDRTEIKVQRENHRLLCLSYNETEHRWIETRHITNQDNCDSYNTITCSYDHNLLINLVVQVKETQTTMDLLRLACLMRNYFIYNMSELKITENLITVTCMWGDTQCFIECSFVNLTTNVTDLRNRAKLVKNDSITDQNKTHLVLNINGQETKCNVTKCVSSEISALISESSNSNDLNINRRPVRIKSMCTTLLKSEMSIKKTYIRAEKSYIDSLINSPFNETTTEYDFEEFNMTVVKTNQSLVQISAPQVQGDNLKPLKVLFPLLSEEPNTVAVVTYPSCDMFTSDTNTVLLSKVIRVETVGVGIKYLSEPLVIDFTMNSSYKIPENKMLSCRFYNVDAVEKEEWGDMGSFTNLENFNISKTVTCSYNHMTPFAVLLVDMKIDPEQWKILSYITYIGCSLSSFFSAVTIFTYVFMKYKDTSIRIHVSLSIALFLLNTSYLFIEWGATWSEESLCVFIAVIIQYSLLSCFSWMAIEAIHLYFLLIKVFNTYVKNYMVKLSLFGWGVPAVLVGGTLCVYNRQPFYGTKEITLSDTNETTKFCWITDSNLLYGMNVSYFSLMFLLNTSILVIVTHQIFKLRSTKVNGSKLPTFKDVCTVLSLSFLLGITWGLAFLSSGYINYPILYLFCICNAFQGLFMFLWFNGTVKKNTRFNAQLSISTMSQLSRANTNTCESSITY